MNLGYDLNRFLKAQEHSYSCALNEMKNGRKQSHWMWYIFPQLTSLGHSSMSQYYGIRDLEEAKLYIEHPVLGARLREISEVLLTLETDDAFSVMGYPDNRKLWSSMTLFSHATSDNQVFKDVLEKFFRGLEDPFTLEKL